MKRFVMLPLMILLVSSLVLIGCARPAPAPAPEALPQSIVISTYPQGTIGHAGVTAIAKIVSTHTTIAASVKPMEGATVQLPMVNRGENDIGLCTFPDLSRAWNGIGEFTEKHANLRHLFYGWLVVPANLVVRVDSNFYKLTDLKGKRVTSDFAGERMIGYQLAVTLASAGMTWDDVVPVPVPNMPASLQALREGRVDAAFALAPTVPITMELDAAIPLRILPLEPGPAFDKALAELLPGSQPAMIKAGVGIAKDDTLSFDLPFSVYSSTHLSEAAAYEVVKAVFENAVEMQPAHPVISRFTGEVMVSRIPPAPFHPGAIRLYKEKGVWTQELEDNQKKFLP